MKKRLGELGFILGSLVIITMGAAAFHTPCGPGCGFVPALVMAGGAGLLLLVPVSISGRILCVLFLGVSLFEAKSEWDARAKASKLGRKMITENLLNIFSEERKSWEADRKYWKEDRKRWEEERRTRPSKE